MRLIDAFSAKEALEYTLVGDAASMAERVIDRQPTIDAVPVVRCRECKYRGTDDCIFHIKGEPADEELLLKLDNDFCSYGKQKEGADNGS